jgi:hypothetical protein
MGMIKMSADGNMAVLHYLFDAEFAMVVIGNGNGAYAGNEELS